MDLLELSGSGKTLDTQRTNVLSSTLTTLCDILCSFWLVWFWVLNLGSCILKVCSTTEIYLKFWYVLFYGPELAVQRWFLSHLLLNVAMMQGGILFRTFAQLCGRLCAVCAWAWTDVVVPWILFLLALLVLPLAKTKQTLAFFFFFVLLWKKEIGVFSS